MEFANSIIYKNEWLDSNITILQYYNIMILDKKIPFQYIFKMIYYDLLYLVLITASVQIINSSFPQFNFNIPIQVPAFIGTSIAILLSFKMNQSYDRWWESRKIWGNIVNDSRTFIIQLLNFLPKEDKNIIHKIALRQIAWTYALSNSLRKLDVLPSVAHFLDKNDTNFIQKHNNKPLAILQLHAQDLKSFQDKQQIDSITHIHLDATLVRLCAAMGQSERIKNTVFPKIYRLFLSFNIYLFIITLSISVEHIRPYIGIPIVITVSILFFLLQKTATYLQDPFNNTPNDVAMNTISNTIETNIKQLIEDENLPQPLPPIKDFYIM